MKLRISHILKDIFPCFCEVLNYNVAAFIVTGVLNQCSNLVLYCLVTLEGSSNQVKLKLPIQVLNG